VILSRVWRTDQVDRGITWWSYVIDQEIGRPEHVACNVDMERVVSLSRTARHALDTASQFCSQGGLNL